MRWARSLPTVRTELECSGRTHRLVWRRGRLALVDHDIDAEIALEGLGGEPTACLGVLRAWREACESGRPLQTFDLGTKRSARSVGPAAALPEALHDVVVAAAMVRAQRRYQARRGEGALKVPPSLQRRMTERVSRGLLASLEPMRRTGDKSKVEFGLKVVPVGESPSVEGAADSKQVRVVLSLPPTWLVEVERPGCAVIEGSFVLRRRGEQAAVLTWESAPSGLRPVLSYGRCVRSDGQWKLELGVPGVPLDVFWSVLVRAS